MRDISDKTLMILFVVAIFTTLGGVLIILGQVGYSPDALITGFVGSTNTTGAVVNVTIQDTRPSSINIELDDYNYRENKAVRHTDSSLSFFPSHLLNKPAR